MEEEKKKNSTKDIIIIFLVAALFGFAGFFVTDKLMNQKPKKNEGGTTEEKEKKKEEKEESITFSDSELQEYVNNLTPVSIEPSELLYNLDTIRSEKMSAKEKIELIGSKVYEKATSSENYEYSILKESDVKEVVEKVYGPNTYEKAEFRLGCGPYELREDGSYYSRTGCGGATATVSKNIVIDYKATKKKLEITTAYAFFDGLTNKIYKDFKLENALEDYSGEDTENYLSNYIKTNKEKLNKFIYTFESEDDKNYYFKELVHQKN